ncbi:MAG: hypothetical protein K8R48_08260, partial [Alphaproteobacteria bacterium]|nr:hypothetical protein [Alphaproteobacteria bacterium]
MEPILTEEELLRTQTVYGPEDPSKVFEEMLAREQMMAKELLAIAQKTIGERSMTFLVNDLINGARVDVWVRITESKNGLEFKIWEDTKAAPDGDLRAFYASVADSALIGTLKMTDLTGGALTATAYGSDSITKVGSSDTTMTGTQTKFDLGAEIGTSGAGHDFYTGFSFRLDSSLRALTLKDVSGQSMGVRLTSSGVTGGDSSKLVEVTSTKLVDAQNSVMSFDDTSVDRGITFDLLKDARAAMDGAASLTITTWKLGDTYHKAGETAIFDEKTGTRITVNADGTATLMGKDATSMSLREIIGQNLVYSVRAADLKDATSFSEDTSTTTLFINGTDQRGTTVTIDLRAEEGKALSFDMHDFVKDADRYDFYSFDLSEPQFAVYDAEGRLVDSKLWMDRIDTSSLIKFDRATGLVSLNSEKGVDALADGWTLEIKGGFKATNQFGDTIGDSYTVSVTGHNSQDGIRDINIPTLEGHVVKGNLLDMAAPVDMNDTFQVYAIDGQKVVWGSSARIDTIEAFAKLKAAAIGDGFDDDTDRAVLGSYSGEAMLMALGDTISSARDLIVYMKGSDLFMKLSTETMAILDKTVAEIDKAAGGAQAIDTLTAFKTIEGYFANNIDLPGFGEMDKFLLSLDVKAMLEKLGGTLDRAADMVSYFKNFEAFAKMDTNAIEGLNKVVAKIDASAGGGSPDSLVFQLASGGHVTLFKSGEFIYDAAGTDTSLGVGMTGKDGFSVQLVDAGGAVTDKGFVTIETEGVNTAPIFIGGQAIEGREGEYWSNTLAVKELDANDAVAFDRVTIATKVLDIAVMIEHDKQDLAMLERNFKKVASALSSKMNFYQERIQEDAAILDEAHKKYDGAARSLTEDMNKLNEQLVSLDRQLADRGYYKQLPELNAKYEPTILELNKAIEEATAKQDWTRVKELSAKLDSVNLEFTKAMDGLQSQYRDVFDAIAKTQEAINTDQAILDKLYQEIVAPAQDAYNNDSAILVELQHKFETLKADFTHNTEWLRTQIDALANAGETVDFFAGQKIIFLVGATLVYDQFGKYISDTTNMNSVAAGDQFSTDMIVSFKDGFDGVTSGKVSYVVDGVDDQVVVNDTRVELWEGKRVEGKFDAHDPDISKDGIQESAVLEQIAVDRGALNVKWHIENALEERKSVDSTFQDQSDVFAGRIKEASVIFYKASEAYNYFYKGTYIPTVEKISAELANISTMLEKYENDPVIMETLRTRDKTKTWYNDETNNLNNKLAEAQAAGDEKAVDMILGLIKELDAKYIETIAGIEARAGSVWNDYTGLVEKHAGLEAKILDLNTQLAGYDTAVHDAQAVVDQLTNDFAIVEAAYKADAGAIDAFIQDLSMSTEDQIIMFKEQLALAEKAFAANMEILQKDLESSVMASKMTQETFDGFYKGYVVDRADLLNVVDKYASAIKGYDAKLVEFYQGLTDIAAKFQPEIDELTQALAAATAKGDTAGIEMYTKELAAVNTDLALAQEKFREPWIPLLTEREKMMTELNAVNDKIVHLDAVYGEQQAILDTANHNVDLANAAIKEAGEGMAHTKGIYEGYIETANLVEFTIGGHHSHGHIHFANDVVGTFTAEGKYNFDAANSLSMSLGESDTLGMVATFADHLGNKTSGNVTVDMFATNENPTPVADTIAAAEGTANGNVFNLAANDTDTDRLDTLGLVAINGIAVTREILNNLPSETITTTHQADTLIHQYEGLVNGIFNGLYGADGVLNQEQLILAREYQAQIIHVLEKAAYEMGDVAGMSIADQLIRFTEIGGVDYIRNAQSTLFTDLKLPEAVIYAEQKFISQWRLVDTYTTTEVIPGKMEIELQGGKMVIDAFGDYVFTFAADANGTIPHG